MRHVQVWMIGAVMVLAMAGLSQAANEPVAVTGWQWDSVLEIGNFTYQEDADSFLLASGIGRFFETGRYQDGGGNDYQCLPYGGDANVGVLVSSNSHSYSMYYGDPDAPETTQDPAYLGLNIATLKLKDAALFNTVATEKVQLTLEEPSAFESLSFLGWGTQQSVTFDFILNEGMANEATLAGAVFRSFEDEGNAPGPEFDGSYAVPVFRDYRGGSHFNDDGAYMTEAEFDLVAMGLDDLEVQTITLHMVDSEFDQYTFGQMVGVAGTVVPEPATLGLVGIAGLGLLRRRR